MKREEALSLLKELMIACESMQLAPIVSLTPNSIPGHWKLSIKWADKEEKDCFKKIIQEKALKAIRTDDGYTTFVKA
jgi:hypothetical protein